MYVVTSFKRKSESLSILETIGHLSGILNPLALTCVGRLISPEAAFTHQIFFIG